MSRRFNKVALCSKLTRLELNEFCKMCGFTGCGYALGDYIEMKNKESYLLIFTNFVDPAHYADIKYIVDDEKCLPYKNNYYPNKNDDWRRFLQGRQKEMDDYPGLQL